MTAGMDAFAGSVLGEDDEAPTSAPPATLAPESLKIAHLIAADLKPDFPPDAYAWVFRVPWKGPVEVPTDQVDMSGRERWRSSREPHKVAAFAELIRDSGDEVKPVLMVRWPGAAKLFCVDGHHRLLGSEAAGRPVRAFVAEVPDDHGPWVTMHSRQLHGQSRFEQG